MAQLEQATPIEGQNQNDYVRKDVFDARMDRMEMLMEKTLMEMKTDNEKLRSEVSAAISEMKADNEKLRSEMNQKFGSLQTEIRVFDARMDGLVSRIDGIQTTVYWGFAIVAIVIAFLPTIQDWRRMFRRPAFTLEDIQQRIDTAIAKALRSKTLS